MAFTLHLHPEHVTQFIRNYSSLSRQSRIRLFAALHEDLAIHRDSYIQDESRRVAAGSPTSGIMSRSGIAMAMAGFTPSGSLWTLPPHPSASSNSSSSKCANGESFSSLVFDIR